MRNLVWVWMLFGLTMQANAQAPQKNPFHDKTVDPQALPKVPDEFRITVFATEPLVRQPCSLAFDERGRLFVGMGPQYRNPVPETPGDSVVIVEDTDGDGQADRTRVFATGFNSIQGLAWHGRDLWVANAPDLTVVRDLNGDDEADEYVCLYTDLGNLEHGLHGLNWAPDGKLYMSKGNSKGLNQPGRYAPRPFRELWGMQAPPDVPDFPEPVVSGKDNYRRAYHHPADDWGLDGGVLRCDEGGHNLEIIARGFRNPWDIACDSGFNWLGTDNDQTTGDRVFMPFFGAHFGWNHPWSSHWSAEPHAPSAPVSGPLFEGSGTGIVFCRSPQFPPAYRGTFLINDWLLKTTYVWRPQWDGALLRPKGGAFESFISGGSSLFRPTDLEFGPDGALWILGWSTGYGAEWQDGQLTNEGRIFRVTWKEAPPAKPLKVGEPLSRFSVDELLEELDSLLPVRRINAQDELVRRGAAVRAQLQEALSHKTWKEHQETWIAWTLGRLDDDSSDITRFFASTLQADAQVSLNLRIQAVRILAFRARRSSRPEQLAASLRKVLSHQEPRLRFAAVQAIQETHLRDLQPDLLGQLVQESDATVRYAGWQALRALNTPAELRRLLTESRPAVRQAALLALLETHSATPAEVRALAASEPASEVRQVAESWLAKATGNTGPTIRGRALQNAPAAPSSPQPPETQVAVVRSVKSQSKAEYKVVPGGARPGTLTYIDRGYRLTKIPPELVGCDLIQTANQDDGSRGTEWLTAETLVPVRVWVGLDARQQAVPGWLQQSFHKTDFTAAIDEGAVFQIYEATFPAGRFELGGNTDDGRAGGKGNYFVAVAPAPLSRLPQKSTEEAVLAQLERGDRARGELLFRHPQGAGCFKCHSLDRAQNGFGPNLSSIGLRAKARHIVQSIVDPGAVITEGFSQLTIVTDEGQVHSGVFLEESGLQLSLGLSTGERLDIPRSAIAERKFTRQSAMPEMAELLEPQQIADLTEFLLSLRTPATDDAARAPQARGFSVAEQSDRLQILLDGSAIVDFVFRDEKILRPYFANAHLPDGLQVTRTHPPVKGTDAVDHDTMHPGIWLGFGDINGEDFWRNKARMDHVRFVSAPAVADGKLRFATECRLKTAGGEPLCKLTNHYTLATRPQGWLLVWNAAFEADQRDIVFGDQEEMGLGARVATPLTEKNGGTIRSASGKKTAQATWG
ncbi:MAG: PmoA family protein, partial [Planctomycetes bacterium]|nr:PmoA family protein [Planctomycetota bacterium]